MIRLPTHRAPTHPGRFLQECLEEFGITQRAAAARLGITAAHLNELIHARCGITPETALRLEKFLGMSAQSWLNGQMAWDWWHTLHAPKIKKVVAKIQPLAPRAA